ncbi:MAG: A/G-specific adenine glycosylase [Candidatus Thermoplasmatota archaeon]
MRQTILEPLFFSRKLTDADIARFHQTILDFYHNHGRSFPWRNTDNPYHILVSEVMLQQTQTDRVVPKYEQFIRTYPDVERLAAASFREILSVWQGLGYNRRALALKKTAEILLTQHHGKVPDTLDELLALPGLGPYSARAILTFAYHQPMVFLETNIRNVYIYFFFQDQTTVHDKELEPLIEKTLYTPDPRTWYYALMDYGAMLKKKNPYLNKKSRHYTRQSRFHGSNRQIRGQILSTLLGTHAVPLVDFCEKLHLSEQTLQPILTQLIHEGLITQKDKYYQLVESSGRVDGTSQQNSQETKD